MATRDWWPYHELYPWHTRIMHEWSSGDTSLCCFGQPNKQTIRIIVQILARYILKTCTYQRPRRLIQGGLCRGPFWDAHCCIIVSLCYGVVTCAMSHKLQINLLFLIICFPNDNSFLIPTSTVGGKRRRRRRTGPAFDGSQKGDLY
jgi:hypothetical protein